MSRYIRTISSLFRKRDFLVCKCPWSLQNYLYPILHYRRISITAPSLNIKSGAGNNIVTRSGQRECHSESNDNNNKSYSHLFMPVAIESDDTTVNVGEELVGPLDKGKVLHILNTFYTSKQMKELSLEHGLDEYLYQQAFVSFRKHCVDSKSLGTDLHIILSDIIQGAGHVHDIFPSFLQHSKRVFPHLVCLDDLCKISDLTNPPNWYTDARSMNRKIVFHAGPTNSGKTYHALEQFLQADSGIYCGPLKLLASEVFNKSNDKGTVCDLVTGEERRYGRADGVASQHTACTVEMAPVNAKYDVAVIDEIQLLRDPTRGWAWTRALLGLCAREVHVCGEEAAIPLVEELAMCTGEELEIHRYKRLTELSIDESALGALSNVRDGDCIVCFNKRDIHHISTSVERLGHQVAVIYGGLPPGTKLAQAQKFNDPSNPCKIMVATDAIGMGLNLSIRRVVFSSLIKPNINEKGEKEMDTISVSQALQIAGRAGRYGTQWEHGFVTTMKSEDLPTLRRLMSSKPEAIVKAGLHPTAEQIELFAYHIPNYTLSNLIDIFVNVSTVDSSLYFMCGMEDFKFLADLIQHVPLPLRARYVFCCAPINKRMPFVCAMFLKFARQFSNSEAANLTWLCQQVKWPLKPPHTIVDLVHLEQVFDVFDLYLWFSYRFPDMFPEGSAVHDVQCELDQMIERSVACITTLLRNSDTRTVTQALDTEDSVSIAQRRATRRQDTILVDPDSLDSPSITLPSHQSKRKNKSISVTYDTQRAPPSRAPGQAVGKGRLTEHLLAQGLLSPQMLSELRREWMDKGGDDDDDDDDSRGSGGGGKHRRKGGHKR